MRRVTAKDPRKSPRSITRTCGPRASQYHCTPKVFNFGSISGTLEAVSSVTPTHQIAGPLTQGLDHQHQPGVCHPRYLLTWLFHSQSTLFSPRAQCTASHTRLTTRFLVPCDRRSQRKAASEVVVLGGSAELAYEFFVSELCQHIPSLPSTAPCLKKRSQCCRAREESSAQQGS